MTINKLTPHKNLLWESSRMMLPEHKEAILQHRRKQTESVKPQLDEQRLDELSKIMTEAVQLQEDVCIVVYHPFQRQVLCGKVTRVDRLNCKIKLTGQGTSTWIALSDILDVRSCRDSLS